MKKQTVIITGTSRGIGLALTHWFLENTKFYVIAVSRSFSEDLTALKNWDDRLILEKFDINASETAYDNWVEKLTSKEIEPIYIINNSGVLVNQRFTELSEADFIYQLQVNVLSVFKMMKHFSKVMPPQSHIVNIGSMGGYQGSSKFPGLSQYSASKGAVAILTECFAEEMKDQKIFANCLALGAVDTEMLSEAFPGYFAGMSPETMAAYIAKFTIEGHHFFNGKVLPVSVSTP